MADVAIRKLNDEAHQELKRRAAKHGRSTEAEMRAILEEVALPRERLKLGTYIVERVREIGGVDLNIQRDQSPIEPASFE